MNLRKSVVLVAALLVTVSALSAYQAKPADLTGVWTGTLTRGDGGASSAYLDLKQKEASLTGTAGPDADRQATIEGGKVAIVKDVTGATFQATQPNGAVLKFDLQLVEGRLKGKVTMERDGETREGTLDDGREKK